MTKKNNILLIVYFFFLSGCVSTIKPVEKNEDDKVVAVGEKEPRERAPDTAQSKVEADTKNKIEKKEREAGALDGIVEETLYAQKTYAPKEGDTVYVNYHTNFVRYIPLRSNPSDNGKILKTICIGSELDVLAVQDRWLYVKGVDAGFMGWVLEHWVTVDGTVKLDAEKRRKEHAPEIARLEAIVKPIPRSKWKDNLRLYEKLLELDPCNSYYQHKVDFYEKYGRRATRGKRK